MKKIWDFSRLCLSQNSIAPHWNYSKTIPKFVLAEIQLHLVEIIYDNSKMFLGRNSIASHRKYSNTIPNCVLAKIQLHLVEIIYDNSKLFLGRNSIASHRNYSNTIPNCVLAKIELHLIGIFLRQFQMVSQPKFHCISSKSFWDFSRLCLSQNSIAPHLNYSNTFPNCVLAEISLHLIEIFMRFLQIVPYPKINCLHRNYSKTLPNCVVVKIQLHLIGIFLRQFQMVSQPKFHCISSILFWDFSRLCLSQNSIAPHLKYSNTFPNCVSAQIQTHLIECSLRQFQIVS